MLLTANNRNARLWQPLFVLLLLVVTALLRIGSCTADTSVEKRKDALRQLVHGYVRAEKKVSYETVLEKVKLILPNDDDDLVSPTEIEEIVKEAYKDTHVYADRLILDMLETVSDPDCTMREFDVSGDNDDFNVTEAANVLHKCKLLVLRNVFDKDFLREYKANFTGYIQGLRNGNISRHGTTTNNENYFLHRLDHGRWEVLLPQNFAHAEVVSNAAVLHVLMQDKILGPELNLHSLGTALADSGARHQDWHTDSDFLFADALYKTTGVSHHELPAYAITMMVPLLYMTPQHGPTQFAIGSSNLAGLTEERDQIHLRDDSLRQHIYDQPDLGADEDFADYKYMRTPLVTFGDVLLFDYQIIHRGGKNVSPDLRAMLYLTYSRFWYKDKGFEEDDEEENDDDPEEVIRAKRQRRLYHQLTSSARFAIPEDFEVSDEYDDVMDADWKEYGDGTGSLEALETFRGKKKRLDVGEVNSEEL